MSNYRVEASVIAESVKVLVVDDHRLVREGICLILASDNNIRVVGEAKEGREAVEVVEALQPNVVLLNIKKPGGLKGLEATIRIKERLPEVQIVLLTDYNDSDFVVEAVKAGAVGYLLTDASKELLCETIKNASAGHILIKSEILRQALTKLVNTPKLANKNPYQRDLSDRETRILSLVTEGQTNRQIGVSLALSEETVKKHIQSIISKLEALDRTHAAVKAVRAGLVS